MNTDARRPWLVLGALAMLQFLIAVDVTVVNVALPSIGAHFAVDARGLTWVVIGYTVTGGGLLMLGGRLGDVLGRRRVLLAGTALFGAASLLAGMAPSFAFLVAARLLQGAGEALALPAAMATIVLLFEEGPARTRALGVWAAVASCGLVLGFALSGIITELFGWRWIFLVAVPFVGVVIVVVLALVPADLRAGRSRRRRPRRDVGSLDVPGAALLVAAPLLFVFGVVEAPVVLPLAAVATALLVVVERRAARPLVPRGFFCVRGRILANLATALLSAALSTAFLLLTFHLQERAELSPLAAGLALLPLALALIAAVTLVPRILGRWGAQTCALTGIGLTALGVLAIAAGAQAGAAAALPGMLLIATGMGFGLVGLQYAAVSGVTEADAGVASGVQRAADQLGGAAGIALYIGIGFADTGLDPFALTAALAVIGLMLAATITRALPQ